MNDITFVFNIEPYKYFLPNNPDVLEKDSQKMAIMLCSSIRSLGINSPILSISSNGNSPDEETLSKFAKLNVSFDNTVVNKNPYNGYFNKVHAYEYFSSSNKITTPYVCFLDVDVLFLKKLDINAIKTALETSDIVSALGYEPEPYIPDGFVLGPKYQRSFPSKECEAYMKRYGIIKTNLIPTGIMFFKNDNNLKILMNKWLEKSEIITKDQSIKNYYTSSNAFLLNALTDEDTFSSILGNRKSEILQMPELVHYHLFQNISYITKEPVSDYINYLSSAKYW